MSHNVKYNVTNAQLERDVVRSKRYAALEDLDA